MEGWQILLAMFAGLILLLATGMPVAIAFGVINTVMLFALVGGAGALQALALSSYSSVASFAFTAVPMFILMGGVALHSGLGTMAITGIGKWLGRMPGRLGVLAVVSGTALGAASGSSMASAATLGTILVPEMRRRGYDKRLAVGCIAAAGALDVLIPPSALTVLMAGISRLSVGELLVGTIVPGLLLASLMFGYIVVLAKLRPDLAPSYDVEALSWLDRLAALREFLPLVVLVLLVLGSIFAGIATSTEAAALGAFGAFVLAACYRRLSRAVIRESLISTVEVTALALFIVTGATAFSQVLAHTGAAAALGRAATELAVSPWLVLVAMQVVILVMGCFMEALSIMLIVVPLFFPVVRVLGFDVVWFAIVTMVNVQLGLITPPFGLDLYVLKGVCPPDITLADIYRGVIPFIVLNLVTIALIITFPSLATWLPGLLR